MVRCNSNCLHLQWVGRGGQTEKKGKEEGMKGKRKKEWLTEWMYERMKLRMNGWNKEIENEWMKERKTEWMDEIKN